MLFQREHHQSIAQILLSLNGTLLRENRCWFGGGTAMAMRFGEYRESVDMDFLVSDSSCYRNLRQLIRERGIAALVRDDAPPLLLARDVRIDQYGIRTMLQAEEAQIKFEIIAEGRLDLQPPKRTDQIGNVSTLCPLDMAAGKLLANSDRWADDGIFNRDLIDLAMMRASSKLLQQAVEKAQQAYGTSILEDLDNAIRRFQEREFWLDRCITALDIRLPKSVLWQRIRSLSRLLTRS
ncbi:MAG: nucleotidyl transferase AbiEii/AbiGii toxin family protein [Proteobacteria bacterium]|nr:nucleotidyl transferase AbiEii/AbiGii toxin family protein [Pseudomonadota bacterium]